MVSTKKSELDDSEGIGLMTYFLEQVEDCEGETFEDVEALTVGEDFEEEKAFGLGFEEDL